MGSAEFLLPDGMIVPESGRAAVDDEIGHEKAGRLEASGARDRHKKRGAHRGMDAFQCDSKRSGWQGLTALRGTALGTSAAPVITATMVAVPAAAAVVAVFATVTARVARRLAAGLAITRATLVAVKITAASTAAAAAVILTLAAEFPFAAGVGLRLWRLGG